MTAKIEEFQSDSRKQESRRDGLEKKLFDTRREIMEAEVELAEKSRVQSGEDKTLTDLQFTLDSSKALMEDYIREYDKLYQKQQQTSFDLEKEKQR